MNVEMKVGQIVNVEIFPEAQKPSYKIWVNFGNNLVRKTSTQLTNYSKSDLLGRQIIAVTNFPKKQIGKFMSEFLILGVLSPKGVILLKPDFDVELGVQMY